VQLVTTKIDFNLHVRVVPLMAQIVARIGQKQGMPWWHARQSVMAIRDVAFLLTSSTEDAGYILIAICMVATGELGHRSGGRLTRYLRVDTCKPLNSCQMAFLCMVLRRLALAQKRPAMDIFT